MSSPTTARCPHVARSRGRRSPRAARTTSSVTAPRAMRPRATSTGRPVLAEHLDAEGARAPDRGQEDELGLPRRRGDGRPRPSGAARGGVLGAHAEAAASPASTVSKSSTSTRTMTDGRTGHGADGTHGPGGRRAAAARWPVRRVGCPDALRPPLRRRSPPRSRPSPCSPPAAQAAPAPFGHACAPTDGVRFCPTTDLAAARGELRRHADRRRRHAAGRPATARSRRSCCSTASAARRRLRGHRRRPSYNNSFFAQHGYAVVTPTARGFGNSCGAAARGRPAARTAGPRLGDMRYEVRDVQTLVGQLVDEGITDPTRSARPASPTAAGSRPCWRS